MLKARISVITGMILFVAGLRLLPHPPNFTPVLAMALFGGAYLTSKRAAFAVPLVAMLLSDLIIGPDHLLPLIYGCIVLTTCLGFMLRTKKGILPVTAAAVASSVLFFVVTNFGVWAFGPFYSKNVVGLIACYVAAIPFFHTMLLGTVVYAALLFGGFTLAERAIPRLREPAYGLSA